MIDQVNVTLKIIPLEKLDLSLRTYNALKRAGINSVYDVCCKIKYDSLWMIRNIGDKSIKEITEKTLQFLSKQDMSPKTVGLPIEVAPKETEVRNSLNKITLPDISLIRDLEISILNNYLGKKTAAALDEIGFHTIQDVNDLFRRYLTFFYPTEQMLPKALNELSSNISDLVEQGRLSLGSVIESSTLSKTLKWMPIDDYQKGKKLRLLKRVLQNKTLSDEIIGLLDEITERQIQTFLGYTLHDLTLDEIGTQQNVSRERIRQILVSTRQKLKIALSHSPQIFISTSFEIANELGLSLSKDNWRNKLIERKLIVDADQNYATFDFFTALLLDKAISQSINGIPENVKRILINNKPLSILVIDALGKTRKEDIKEIRRICNYTGGINIEHAAQLLAFDFNTTDKLLRAIGLIEVTPGWFTTTSGNELNKNTPLLRGGLIMIQSCGPLPFESFCDGLRKYISRHYEALAPAEVIRRHVSQLGFIIENNIVNYEGKEKVKISESEKVFIDLVVKKGPVLTFQEIVEFYLAHDKSAASASTRVIPQSPMVEKIEYGLYKLRGSKVTWEDIEIAKSRQEEFAKNSEVSYGLDGIIRYRITLGTWATGGVLSISKSCQPLPDLGKGWPVYVNQEKVSTARRDDYLLWGLAPALSKIGGKPGDRIELAFDTWRQPKIIIRIIEDYHE